MLPQVTERMRGRQREREIEGVRDGGKNKTGDKSECVCISKCQVNLEKTFLMTQKNKAKKIWCFHQLFIQALQSKVSSDDGTIG